MVGELFSHRVVTSVKMQQMAIVSQELVKGVAQRAVAQKWGKITQG